MSARARRHRPPLPLGATALAILALFAASPARAADCDPVPAPVLARWPLVRDGRDVRGETPLAAVGPVRWPVGFPGARTPPAFVALGPGSRLEATDVALPGAWTLSVRTDADEAPSVELLRVADDGGRWLSLRLEGPELVLQDQRGQTHRVPRPAEVGRLGLAVDGDIVQVLAAGALNPAPWPAAEVPQGGARVTVGEGGGAVRVRDLVLHGEAAAYGDRPWCLPVATRDVPPVEPSLREPKLEFGGYFLGWIGAVPNDRFVARQRLLLEPTVRLSPHTRVTVGVRALDARAVDRTGSTLQPVPPAASALGEYGVVVEHAYLARWVGEWRLFPFYFVAGRIPLTFGMGLDDRSPMASLEPPPASTTALLDAGRRTGLQPGNGDQFGDPTFPSTIDGPMLFFGAPPRRGDEQGRLLVGFRGGRHNSWCAGRSSPVCPEGFAPTYEFAVTGVVEQQLSGGPASGADGLVVQADVGGRWALGLRPGVFLRLAAAYERPRTELLWTSVAFEALGSTGIRGVPAFDPADPTLPALQFLGDVVGGAARVDLAVRPLAAGTLTVEGGATGAIDGLAGAAPVRGLHPDYNFDLVLFSQVVSAATAAASPARVVPTFGGVVNAGFVRAGPTVRFGDRSGIEVPLFFATAWSLGPLPGVMGRGWLGLELDTALRLHSGDWRLAFDYGVLLAHGAGLGPVVVDPRRPMSFEARIGRDL